MKASLLSIFIMFNVCLADDMGSRTPIPKYKSKYKVGDTILMNLKDSKHNGKCDGIGIVRYIGPTGRHYIKGVTCRWGIEDTFSIDEVDIADVLVKEDFEPGGRYAKRGIIKSVLFFRDKSKDYLPCWRSKIKNEEIKEELCNDNPFEWF